SKRRHHRSPSPPTDQERVYRGPAPAIPDLIHPNPREFARLKIALENILPADATECLKFHILLEHLKLEEAQLIAESYSSSHHPYTNTMDALSQQYGQPHQLALQRIAELMDGPSIITGDIKTFRMYALRVRSLVGMLRQLGKPGMVELRCGSHVSRLLSKLPHDLRSSFRRFIYPLDVKIPTLLNFADSLEYEIQVQEDSTRILNQFIQGDIKEEKSPSSPPYSSSVTAKTTKGKAYCPYSDNNKHTLNNCVNFSQLSKSQRQNWIKGHNRCWRCGWGHRSSECNLKMRCQTCN
ncbi:hypothetical protein M9458_045154, partial [Cirrhinus mrigala]